MRYQGGKNKLARRLAAEISTRIKTKTIVEPFCGSGAVTAEFCRMGFSVEASDANPCIPPMLDAVKAGWLPSEEELTRTNYEAAKELPDDEPLKACLAFGMSHGGKWFSGYAAKGNKWDNFPRQLRKSLAAKAQHFGRATFRVARFEDVRPTPGSAAYLDPPYRGTTGYPTGDFDTAKFWLCAQEWADMGVDVFVSEFDAPGFVGLVAEFDRPRGLGSGHATERLFRIPPRVLR